MLLRSPLLDMTPTASASSLFSRASLPEGISCILDKLAIDESWLWTRIGFIGLAMVPSNLYLVRRNSLDWLLVDGEGERKVRAISLHACSDNCITEEGLLGGKHARRESV